MRQRNRKAMSAFLVKTGIAGIITLFLVSIAYAEIPVSDGFDFPVGKPDGVGYIHGLPTDNNGWDFLENEGTAINPIIHPGEDWNGDGGGDTDLGDAVYAISNGHIVAAEDYGSRWGNIVLIEHRLHDGTSVWSNYAHLQDIIVSSGDVSRGQQIGTIGKGYNNEYNAHLHFEIRKNYLSPKNWPSGQTEVQVLANYYDPSDFIDYHRPGIWNFNIPGNSEGWFAHNVQSTSVAPDGRYRIDPNTAYPLIQHDGLSLDANNYNAIEINMASNAPSGDAKLYFTTTSSPGYSDDKRVEFIVRHDGNWYTYIVYMKNNPEWKGTITGIKIDPAAFGKPGVDPSDTIGFDWIKFIKTDMKPAIISVGSEYQVYSQGDIVNFNYWITNPFANNMPNTEIYAAIRRSNSGDSWITTDTLFFEGVTLRSATTTYGEAEFYTKAISLPALASTGSYDAYAWVANQHPGFLFPYQSSDYIYDFRDLPYAFTVNALNPVIIDPTPTLTPVPTYNPPPPATPTPTPIPTPEIFDIDENYQINMDDVVIVFSHFNETTLAPYPRHDVNQDGVVDILDVALVCTRVT